MSMKKLLALLLAIVMVFCLAACGDDAGSDDDDDKKESSSESGDSGKKEEGVQGTWKAVVTQEDENGVTLSFTMKLVLDEDSYTMGVDKAASRGPIKDYLTECAELGWDNTVAYYGDEETAEAETGYTRKSYIAESTSDEMLDYTMDAMIEAMEDTGSTEGSYTLDGNKVILTNDSGEDEEGVLDGDTLTFEDTDETLGGDLVFKRA